MTMVKAVLVSGRVRDDAPKPRSCARGRTRPPIHIVPSSPTKRIISIKALLEWAYRDELVHAARPEGEPLELARDYSPGRSEWLPDVVDSSAKYGFEAAADAYAVHRAVLALGNEPLIVPAWEPPPHAMLDFTGQLPSRPALKTQSLAALVMGAALRGAPSPCLLPEIEVERGVKIYRRQPNGQPARDRAGRAIEEACLVRFTGDLPWIVAHQRFIYEAWANALWVLADSLTLGAHELSTELPPRKPWLFC